MRWARPITDTHSLARGSVPSLTVAVQSAAPLASATGTARSWGGSAISPWAPACAASSLVGIQLTWIALTVSCLSGVAPWTKRTCLPNASVPSRSSVKFELKAISPFSSLCAGACRAHQVALLLVLS